MTPREALTAALLAMEAAREAMLAQPHDVEVCVQFNLAAIETRRRFDAWCDEAHRIARERRKGAA